MSIHSDKQITVLAYLNMLKWIKYINISFQAYSYILYDNSGVLYKVPQVLAYINVLNYMPCMVAVFKHGLLK